MMGEMFVKPSDEVSAVLLVSLLSLKTGKVPITLNIQLNSAISANRVEFPLDLPLFSQLVTMLDLGYPLAQINPGYLERL